MSLAQFVNTLLLISRNRNINRFNSISKHLFWQIRKLFNLYPYKQKISNSIIMAIDKNSGVSALINSLGIYDYNNMNLIKVLLKDGMNFIDIGANIGSYTLIASEQKKVNVYSFEAHPKTFKSLLDNIRINNRSNVKAFNLAVSNNEGEVFFSNYTENSVNHILTEKENNSIVVKCTRIETIFEKDQIIPDIVKIDVEGSEINVLLGFGKYLKDVKVFFIESTELTEKRISDMLCLNNFIGPFCFDYKRSSFYPYSNNVEDTIYIAKSFEEKLIKLNFQLLL